MKQSATQSNGQSGLNHRQSFQAVFDSRKRKVPGLWQRGEKFYAQIRTELSDGTTAPRRYSLAATNLEEAKAELEKKRTEKRAGTLPAPGYRPKFKDFTAEYLTGPILAEKKAGTQENEKQAIKRLNNHPLGELRLDKIDGTIIKAFREKRLIGGCSARTANLDVVVLRNVLKLAVDRGLLTSLPDVKQLKTKPSQRRPLLTKEQFGKLLDASTPENTKNAELFRYYLRFLALTGAREKEALLVSWADVDSTRETVTIGSGGASKNHRARTVDFSAELKALLAEMKEARPPDISWLFPSPQRGAKDEHAMSLRESLKAVRTKAGLTWMAFHDLRHFFASQCVMAGLDFMTIAEWLGHSDGGILVGKTYGHLLDSHKKAAARKLNFFTEASK
jgi:integrase